MLNKTASSFLILCSFIGLSRVYAQDEYYQSAFLLQGETLKAELHTLIKGHKEYPYTSSSTDVWDILKETDKDTANADNVILIYSGRSVDAAQEYNSGAGWTREHVWAKSRGDFGTDEGAGTDAHHLRPCDNSINSKRNNRNFDNCINCVDVIDEGENTGSKTDEDLWTFEPRDEVKGDVARMVFYMAVRYEGFDGELDLELQNAYLDKSDKSAYHSRLSTLLIWNKEDPVDAFERNRNEIVYSFQNNRNPFIDFPILAEYLWGKYAQIAWNPLASIDRPDMPTRIYPNPTSGRFYVDFEYDSIEVYSPLNGKILLSFNQNEANDLSTLEQGVYLLRILGGEYHGSVKRLILN